MSWSEWITRFTFHVNLFESDSGSKRADSMTCDFSTLHIITKYFLISYQSFIDGSWVIGVSSELNLNGDSFHAHPLMLTSKPYAKPSTSLYKATILHVSDLTCSHILINSKLDSSWVISVTLEKTWDHHHTMHVSDLLKQLILFLYISIHLIKKENIMIFIEYQYDVMPWCDGTFKVRILRSKNK